MTQFFYDTEFIDDGHTIDLISIGIVREDGREYYAVSYEFDIGKLHANKWLLDNVWPHLPLVDRYGGRYLGRLDLDHPDVKSRMRIVDEAYQFLVTDDVDESPAELWAWYATYDHVCLAQLWGSMINLPSGIPMYTRDLKQEADRLEEVLGRDIGLPNQPDGEHNALADARHNLVRARYLDQRRVVAP